MDNFGTVELPGRQMEIRWRKWDGSQGRRAPPIRRESVCRKSRQEAGMATFKDWVTGSGIYRGGDDQGGQCYREEPEEKKGARRDGRCLFVSHFFSFVVD